MTLSIEAVMSTLTVAVLASIGAYIGTIRWIAKIDKNKVSHEVCSRHRMNCPCLSDIVELKEKMKYVFLAAIFILISVLSACSTTINNYGNDNKLELSPARNLYPDVSVMNGLSVIPRSNEAAEEK